MHFLHVRFSVAATKMLTRFQAKMWNKTKSNCSYVNTQFLLLTVNLSGALKKSTGIENYIKHIPCVQEQKEI